MNDPAGAAEELWINVPSWDRFQHYNDRDAPWLKVYRELLHKPEFNDLSLAARGLLLTVWLEYLSSNGLVRARSLSSVCRQKVRRDTLDSVLQAGFLELSASTPLALRTRQGRGLSKERPKSALAAAHAAPPLLSAAEGEQTPSPSEPHYPGEAAQARQLYNPDEPERDLLALERIRELAARMGVRHMPGSADEEAPRGVWREGGVRADSDTNGANPHGEPSVD